MTNQKPTLAETGVFAIFDWMLYGTITHDDSES